MHLKGRAAVSSDSVMSTAHLPPNGDILALTPIRYILTLYLLGDKTSLSPTRDRRGLQ